MAGLYDDSALPSPARSQLSSYPYNQPPSASGSRVISHKIKTLEGSATQYTSLTDWSCKECADFLTNLGLKQYCQSFVENAIVGDALVALSHEDLKEMGIRSAGHRLTILKTVYELKILQGVPLEPDHFIPPSSTTSPLRGTPTPTEFAWAVQSIRVHDDRTSALEAEVRKLCEDQRRQREEFLPLLKMAKELKQPLPSMPSSTPFPSMSNNYNSHRHPPPPPLFATDATSNLAPTPTHEKSSNSLTRTLSKKLFSSSSNSNSRNHPPLASIHQLPSPSESKDGASNGTHPPPQQMPQGTTLPFSPNMSGQISPSFPSSSSTNQNQPAAPRLNFFNDHHSPNHVRLPPPNEHNDNLPSPNRATPPLSNNNPSKAKSSSPSRNNNPGIYGRHHGDSNHASNASNSNNNSNNNNNNNNNNTTTSTTNTTNPPNTTNSAPEGTKSFRVTLDDPCYKVLPAAMKKYNISDDWRLYALYIIYGTEERCLAMDERPLLLFKQLDKEGKSPMFMLRKQPQYGGETSSSGGQNQGTAATGATGINLLPNTTVTPPDVSGARSNLNASSSPNVATSVPTTVNITNTTAATSSSMPASSTHTPPSGMI